MRILITGAGGFVGRRLTERYGAAHTVIGMPSDIVRGGDADAVSDFCKQASPDVIFHTAAISDTGECEKNPDASYRANVTLTLSVCRAARDTGAKLLCFSSDQVYNGTDGDRPYSEADPVRPQNVYGRHKLEAENRGLDLLPTAVFLRATWMYDMPLYGFANRGNFLVNLLDAVRENRVSRFSPVTKRGITYVRQAAELLLPAARLDGGVYNFGSENPLSVYDTARALFSALGIADRAGELLVPDEAMTRHSLWISTEKLKKNGLVFDTTAAGFARCVSDYRLN